MSSNHLCLISDIIQPCFSTLLKFAEGAIINSQVQSSDQWFWFYFVTVGAGDSNLYPSAGLLQQLEELMVEGDLLEISLEEKEQLRAILNQFHVAYKGLSLVFPVGDISFTVCFRNFKQ